MIKMNVLLTVNIMNVCIIYIILLYITHIYIYINNHYTYVCVCLFNIHTMYYVYIYIYSMSICIISVISSQVFLWEAIYRWGYVMGMACDCLKLAMTGDTYQPSLCLQGI